MVWPSGSAAGDAVLRRILAGLWGLALGAMLLMPSLSLTEGFGFAEVETPPARYQRVVFALAGLASLIGAARGTRVWGRVVLVCVPLLLGLGAWEAVAHPGPWWSVWWAPTLGTLLVGVPAWLLLTPRASTGPLRPRQGPAP